MVANTGETMQRVGTAIQRVTDIMGEIVAASDEQSRDIEQVSQAIPQMDEITQQNAALVEEAAAAAGSMKDQAYPLTPAVAVFKTGRTSAPQHRASTALPGKQAVSRTPTRTVQPAAELAPANSGRGTAMAHGDWSAF